MNNIPTRYKGIELKSRLEASTAFMLDVFGIKWVYEPYSLKLPDGVDYRPDFYCHEINLWVESRGYVNEKGERQIKTFSKMVVDDEVLPLLGVDDSKLCDYLVIRGDGVQFFEEAWRFGLGYHEQNEVYICKCARCGNHFIVGSEGCYACRACGWWRGNDHLAEVVTLTVDSGKLFLNGQDLSKYGKGDERWWQTTINRCLTKHVRS